MICKKNPKSTMPQRKLAKMTYVLAWMHWLAEQGPKFGKYWFSKFVWQTVRDHRKGAKIIFKLLFLSRGRVKKKNKERYPTKKICES